MQTLEKKRIPVSGIYGFFDELLFELIGILLNSLLFAITFVSDRPN